jgi:glucosamine--fructose-6-phosphate aminotransferase (isomerizing)
MMDTIAVTASFDPAQTREVAGEVKAAARLMLTGEGSSRIFPAKNMMRKAMTWGVDLAMKINLDKPQRARKVGNEYVAA